MSFVSVCNHTRDKQIVLPLCSRLILLSLIWLQTKDYSVLLPLITQSSMWILLSWPASLFLCLLLYSRLETGIQNQDHPVANLPLLILIDPPELQPISEKELILGQGSYGRCILKSFKRLNVLVVEKQCLMQSTKEMVKEAQIM